jgi:hypothetical protein
MMAGLQDAQARLAKAVARLETALFERENRLAARDAVAEAERARGPNIEELVQALDGAQKENAALIAEREAMARQLDTLIARLNAVLAQGAPDQHPDAPQRASTA